MRKCCLDLEPLQFNWFRAAVRLCNALTQRNSFNARKILQADMQLSSRCDDCWSSHILSAMNGLTQSNLFKERLLKCEPIDLGRFVVDLRERHLNRWIPYSDMHPRERNSKRSTYHQWCALPTKRALVTHSPYILCKPGLGHPILTTRQRNGELLLIESFKKWLVTVFKRILMVKYTTPSWCVMCECGLEPLQFNCYQAAVRLYNALTHSNSSTARKILHADMQLSSQCDDCWSSHILSAMNGLTQFYLFKERLLKCEPIDLGRIVVDLRERHLDYWTPYSDVHPRERNSKRSINGVPSLPGGPWSHIRHTHFLDTCLLIFLVTIFAAWLASDFVPTLYELKL